MSIWCVSGLDQAQSVWPGASRAQRAVIDDRHGLLAVALATLAFEVMAEHDEDAKSARGIRVWLIRASRGIKVGRCDNIRSAARERQFVQ